MALQGIVVKKAGKSCSCCTRERHALQWRRGGEVGWAHASAGCRPHHHSLIYSFNTQPCIPLHAGTQARKLLSTMGRRMVQNKIIVGGICLFLLLAIIMIIWSKVH